MPLLLADFIYSRDCKLNLRKNVDTTRLSGLCINWGSATVIVNGKNFRKISGCSSLLITRHFLRRHIVERIINYRRY